MKYNIFETKTTETSENGSIIRYYILWIKFKKYIIYRHTEKSNT